METLNYTQVCKEIETRGYANKIKTSYDVGNPQIVFKSYRKNGSNSLVQCFGDSITRSAFENILAKVNKNEKPAKGYGCVVLGTRIERFMGMPVKNEKSFEEACELARYMSKTKFCKLGPVSVFGEGKILASYDKGEVV